MWKGSRAEARGNIHPPNHQTIKPSNHHLRLVLDYVLLDSFSLPRSMAQMASAVFVLDFLHLDSSSSVQSMAPWSDNFLQCTVNAECCTYLYTSVHIYNHLNHVHIWSRTCIPPSLMQPNYTHAILRHAVDFYPWPLAWIALSRSHLRALHQAKTPTSPGVCLRTAMAHDFCHSISKVYHSISKIYHSIS